MTEKLSARRISDSHEARLLMDDFSSRIDPDVMLAAYGPGFPRPLRYWDRLFEYRVPDVPGIAAWGRITPEPEEGAVWAGVGVFPHAQRRGVRKLVYMHLAWTAFHDYSEMDVWQVRVGVLLENTPQLRRHVAESAAGGPFRFSGHIHYPSSYFVFTLTKAEFLRLSDGAK